MKDVRDALARAAHDTAAYVTADIRHTAAEHGWDPEVSSSLSVHYGEDGYNVTVPDHLKDRAFVHEFGDERNAPTAAMRKYSNSREIASKVLLKNIEKHLGGKL
jgi:glycosidase